MIKKEDNKMGLDWISVVPITREDQESYIKTHHSKDLEKESMDSLVETRAPRFKKPCMLVGARKWKEAPDFVEHVITVYEHRKNSDKPLTIEQVTELLADEIACHACPFLQDLKGACVQNSPFLGLTVSSCDFRGKVVSADEGISVRFRNLAYEDLNCKEMVSFAYELEKETNRLKENECFKKISYSEYTKQFNKNSYNAFRETSPLSKESYEKALHWREQNLRDAIHWLRTCAKYGISMTANY